MIHLAFEGSILENQKTGLGMYALNLLNELKKFKELKISILHSSKSWLGPDLGLETVSYYFMKPTFAIKFRLNKVLSNIGADVFHAPANTGIPQNVDCPSVVTIHDLFPLLYPTISNWKYRLSFKLLSTWAVKSAKYIICNSNKTKNEIKSYFMVSEDKLVVTHLGPCLKACWGGGGNYFLCVGALEDRKGQLLLVQSYLQALKINNRIPNLVLVGPDRGLGPQINQYITKSQGKIIWKKYVQDSDLIHLYSKCKAVMVPSQYEGFGLPVLEGLSSGAPVLCSDIEIFHEVGKSYAKFYPYGNVEAWSTAFLDCELRGARLSQEYIKDFSWKSCATKTVAVYHKVVGYTS